MTIQEISKKTNEAKRTVLDMCISAGKGHVTTAFSCAEIVAVLYYKILKIDPKQPNWENRDRFVMSKNHGSVMTYSRLADLRFLDAAELNTFMKDGSRLGGHSKLCVPGVDFAGGSLGIGLGVAVGMAYAAKMDQKPWLTYCLLGDAECYEGAIWEAAMLAGHHKLSNLIAILDRNQMGVTGFTEEQLKLEPLAEKWSAFGWAVREIDGHDIGELAAALSDAQSEKRDRPLIFIAKTVKGHGIDFMSNKPLYHGEPPRKEKIEQAYMQLEVKWS